MVFSKLFDTSTVAISLHFERLALVCFDPHPLPRGLARNGCSAGLVVIGSGQGSMRAGCHVVTLSQHDLGLWTQMPVDPSSRMFARGSASYYPAHTPVREIPWHAGPGAFIEQIPAPPPAKET